MALTSEMQPYEILVRFAPDGSIAGAHYKTLRVFSENQQIVTNTEIVAPLDLPDDLRAQLAAAMAAKLLPSA